MNHKHSNYLINRGPPLNQHGDPDLGKNNKKNTLIHTDTQVKVEAPAGFFCQHKKRKKND